MNGLTPNGQKVKFSIKCSIRPELNFSEFQAKSPTPSKPTAPPINVPPPPCAPYCPKPGQLKIEKRGKIVNDLVDIDFEQTVMK